ncbi:MAG: hypothetical protein V4487_08900 [Chlamydiota bacterium]
MSTVTNAPKFYKLKIDCCPHFDLAKDSEGYYVKLERFNLLFLLYGNSTIFRSSTGTININWATGEGKENIKSKVKSKVEAIACEPCIHSSNFKNLKVIGSYTDYVQHFPETLIGRVTLASSDEKKENSSMKE